MGKLKDTAVFGLGYFGKFHAKDHAFLGRLALCADKNPEKRKIAEDLGAEFLYSDLSENVIVKRDKRGNPADHLIKKSPTLDELEKINNWDIVTSTENHFPLILLGLELGKNIFVEKPPAERVSEFQYILERFPKAKIGVDYIEMAHPAVLAVKKEMAKVRFKTFYFFHRRSKNLIEDRKKIGRRLGLDIISEELVHDLSEIDFFRNGLRDFPQVVKAEVRSWESAGYPYSANVRANFNLRFSDGAEAEIEGDFLNREVRQFVAVNRQLSLAFYGNTLARDWINPAAAVVEGRKNIDFLIEAVKKYQIISQENQKEILEKVCAKSIKLDRYKEQPLLTMIKNFYEAKSKSGLICPLDRALEYQRIVEEVYRVSGTIDKRMRSATLND